MKIFGVCGNPILHSLSPKLFKAAYGSEYAYLRLLSKTTEGALALFHKLGMSGMNVTAPFKDVNLWGMGIQSPDVKILGMTNTIVKEGDTLKFYNTDIDGVTYKLGNIKGVKCLVLGAGGAGTSAVYALKKLGGEVTIANRTVSKAKIIAEKFECNYCGLDNLPEADIVVNTLRVRVLDIRENQTLVDAIYNNSPYIGTKCNYIDGLQWLKGQAITAYRLFTSREAVIDSIDSSIPNTIKLVGRRAEEVTKFFPKEQISDNGMEIWLYDDGMDNYVQTAWAVIDASSKTNKEIYEEIHQAI